jgi:hypothetical protein
MAVEPICDMTVRNDLDRFHLVIDAIDRLDSKCRLRAWASTASKKASAISPSSNRCRFFVNTLRSQIGSSMFSPTNHSGNLGR